MMNIAELESEIARLTKERERIVAAERDRASREFIWFNGITANDEWNSQLHYTTSAMAGEFRPTPAYFSDVPKEAK